MHTKPVMPAEPLVFGRCRVCKRKYLLVESLCPTCYITRKVKREFPEAEVEVCDDHR